MEIRSTSSSEISSLAAVVKFRRARRGMVRHRLRVFERTGVLQVGDNAGRAESVIADPGLEAERGRAAPDHTVGFLLLAGLAASSAEKRPLGIDGDAGGRDVLVGITLQIVATKKFMLFVPGFSSSTRTASRSSGMFSWVSISKAAASFSRSVLRSRCSRARRPQAK